jgi:hypothetical protein
LNAHSDDVNIANAPWITHLNPSFVTTLFQVYTLQSILKSIHSIHLNTTAKKSGFFEKPDFSPAAANPNSKTQTCHSPPYPS